METIDRKKYLTFAEVHRLLAVASSFRDSVGRRDHAWLLLALNSGLRVSELCKLRCQDVCREETRDSHGTFVLFAVDVYDGKRGKSRRVYIPDKAFEVVDSMRDRRPDSDPLFAHEWRGKVRSYNRRTFNYRMRRLCEAAGLPTHYSPHCLRHTYATHYMEASGNLEALREQLGHEKLSTTQKYLWTTKREHVKAIEKLRPLLGAESARSTSQWE